jgi:hypothetical protein
MTLRVLMDVLQYFNNCFGRRGRARVALDKDFTCWYQPVIGSSGKEPDFRSEHL